LEHKGLLLMFSRRMGIAFGQKCHHGGWRGRLDWQWTCWATLKKRKSI
jgi:hypothetical protein